MEGDIPTLNYLIKKAEESKVKTEDNAEFICKQGRDDESWWMKRGNI